MPKNKIIVLSDIHISTNEPTNWYQKDFHEPYLSAILDYVIAVYAVMRYNKILF
jgi:hypothetical protein